MYNNYNQANNYFNLSILSSLRSFTNEKGNFYFVIELQKQNRTNKHPINLFNN